MRIENLDLTIKNRPIFHSLNLNLVEGKVNVLFGPNGIGKSTLLDVMAGLHKDCNKSLIKFPSESEIAYQLQGVPFLASLTGKDIYHFFLKCDHKYNHNKIELSDFISDIEEQELMKRLYPIKFGQMSGGERRWLIIIGICSLHRKLYLFDEPINGIDPEYKEKIYIKLDRMARNDGKMIVMTTHQLKDLAYYNFHLHFLYQGKIQFSGSYEEFLNITQGETTNPDIAFKLLKQGLKKNAEIYVR